MLRSLTLPLLLTSILVASSCVLSAQFGCTDPCACNYDPDAWIDTGLCTYDRCIEVEISADGNVSADNSRWEIRDAYGRVQYARAAVNTVISCSGMDCFTFHVYDDGGDGWGQFGGYTIFVDGEIVLDESFDTGTYDSMNASTPGCNAVFGCNIPFACNYNAAANFFDDSCTYEGCTDPAAENYEPEAGCDSGNCVYTTTCDGFPEAPDGRQQGFTGELSPDEFFPTYGNGNGEIYHNSNTVVFISSDTSTVGFMSSETSIQKFLPYVGEVTFDWEYYTLDAQSSYDYPFSACSGGGDILSSNESGQDTYQYGTYTLDCDITPTIYLGIVASLISGNPEPGFFKITNFRSPTFQCGCRILGSCNYNPDSMTGPEDCDFSCRTCNEPGSCNYEQSLNPTGAVMPPAAYNGLIVEYPWSSTEDAQAFYDANFQLIPCLPDLTDLGCYCLEELIQQGASTWIQQEGSSETDVLGQSFTCDGHEMMGCFGGNSSTVVANYPCTSRPLIFFSNAYQSDIVINVQNDAPELIIVGDSFNSSVTVNRPEGTMVTVLDEGLSYTENIVTTSNCGCTNTEACNYAPSALTDSGGCKYPDGCDDPSAFNYKPDIQNCPAPCIYLDACKRLGNTAEGRQAGFSGVFAPENWVGGATSGDGTISFSDWSMEIVGDNSGEDYALTVNQLDLPMDGVYSFDWSYSTTDDPRKDYARVFAGSLWFLSDDYGAQEQNGSFSFYGTAGDELLFSVITTDGLGGAARLNIYNFSGPGLPPCQPGCTNPLACNYDPAAVDDNGTCFIEGCGGCTNASASNYDPAAVWDDGSCIDDNLCPTDLDNSGQTATGDLLMLLAAFGTSCL